MEDAPRHSEMDLRDAAQRRISALSGRAKTTQNRFSLFYEAPRIDVGRAGRASAAHLLSTGSSPGPSSARGHDGVLPGDSTAASRGSSGSSSGSGQTERKDYIERRRMDKETGNISRYKMGRKQTSNDRNSNTIAQYTVLSIEYEGLYLDLGDWM